jgi:D-3-phosphoglycerate dehydrogenase / 2-oxoglutarate reductase
MKVLIADKFPTTSRQELERASMTVVYEPEAGGERLPSLVGDADVLVVRSTKVSAAVLAAGSCLQLVVRAGAGVNTIDVGTASARGIFVANCPGKNAIAVAELAVGLLLGLDRRIGQASAELKAGQWNKKEYGKADGLFGRTLGVVGLGEIGREVVPRARGLGMRVVAWSRSLTDAAAHGLGVTRMPDLDALATESDAVSVHVAYSPETRGLLGRPFFARMRERALLVNTSRAGVVDEPALLEAMSKHGLRYAADVFDGEPEAGTAEFSSPVTRHPATLVTPHVGASTEQAQQAVADETVRIIKSFTQSGLVPNCVNLARRTPARAQLNVRHLDREGVLAGVFSAIREAGINVEEVENVIFEGALAACARIRLERHPGAALVQAVERQQHVIGAQVVELE